MKILHFADVHLDRPLVGLPPDVGRHRRLELRAAFRRCLAAAREHHVDLVTIGGDLWEDEHVTPDTRRFVASELEALGLPVLMICGNHDPYLAGGNYARSAWPDNVRICRRDVLTEFEFGPVSVWAVSWLGGRLDMGFLEGFEAPKDGRVHLLLAHGTAIGPFDPQSDSAAAPFDPERVGRCGFALCLAGHIHAGSEIGPVVYPGSPEPLGWGEMGRHAVVVLDVVDDTPRVTFHDINQRRYMARVIDCDDAASSAAIEQRVQEALTDSDPASVYLRLDLKGLIAPDCDLDVSALEDSYRGNYAALQVRDRTFPEYDLAAFERQNTATGHFVRSLQARIKDTTEPALRDQLERALRLGLHALHGRKELIHVD
jgi:DNA repair exonuclease SbcCD nuclease subunit